MISRVSNSFSGESARTVALVRKATSPSAVMLILIDCFLEAGTRTNLSLLPLDARSLAFFQTEVVADGNILASGLDLDRPLFTAKHVVGDHDRLASRMEQNSVAGISSSDENIVADNDISVMALRFVGGEVEFCETHVAIADVAASAAARVSLAFRRVVDEYVSNYL